MEHLDSVINLIQQGDFFTSLDLSDAYFSIPIAENDKKYLRFLWQGDLYQYEVLCFGLATAPRVFTKCTKPIIAHLREKGFKISIYIDDLILIHEDPHALTTQLNLVTELFEKLGFSINHNKSIMSPTQYIQHLGFLLDSRKLDISLPQNKKENVIDLSWKLLTHSNKVSIRQVARVIGCYNAYAKATKWGNLYIRNLERDKVRSLAINKGNYDAFMNISETAKSDIRWWISQEIDIPRHMFLEKPIMTLFSDASGTGWGAHNIEGKTGGRWSPNECSHHINWLELQACFLGLQCFARDCKNSFIHAKLDNTVAISYISNQGGVIGDLDRLAKSVWKWCKERNVWLSASHIPGVENKLADEKSRVFHTNTEWSLSDSAFNQIVNRFTTPRVDLFASRLNHKTQAYCSWEPDPKSLHVDSFTLDWGNLGTCYAFPPFNLVGHVIKKLQIDEVEDLLLVCPDWPAQYWYPMIQRHIKTPDQAIHFGNHKDLLYLPFDTTRVHELWNKINLCCFRLSYKR